MNNCLWFFFALFAVSINGEQLKIIGGNDAKISDLPYQLQLEQEGWLICGASIIGDFFALTSASCVLGYSQRELTVRAGSDRNSYGGLIHQVYRINVHPKYDEYYHDYDIAVLEVATPFRIDNNTQIVQVSSLEAVAGEMARISGWGQKSDDQSSVNQLQVAEIPIIPRENCTTIYSGDVTQRMICAGLKGRDSCNGDTGGPLVSVKSNFQVGVRSWSYGCALEGYPGVYVNLANKEVQDFISCVLNNSCN